MTGFVGGTWNRFGRYYAVREGDAHSWVEAYIDDPARPRRGARSTRRRRAARSRSSRRAASTTTCATSSRRSRSAGTRTSSATTCASRCTSSRSSVAGTSECARRRASIADRSTRSRARRWSRRACWPCWARGTSSGSDGARPERPTGWREARERLTARRGRGSLPSTGDRAAASGHQQSALDPAAAARRGAQVAQPPAGRRGPVAHAGLSRDALRRRGADRRCEAQASSGACGDPRGASGRGRPCADLLDVPARPARPARSPAQTPERQP